MLATERRDKNLIVKRLGLLICLLSLSSFSTGVAQADSHCDFAEETVLIGGVVPLSSPGSVTGGIGMDWGFQQASADINADCGIKIGDAHHRVKVITVDSEGVSEFGQLVVERLILQDEVHGIVGFYHSAVGLATMGMVQRYRMPTIYAHPRNDSISAAGYIEYEGAPPRKNDGIDYVFAPRRPAQSSARSSPTGWSSKASKMLCSSWKIPITGIRRRRPNGRIWNGPA